MPPARLALLAAACSLAAQTHVYVGRLASRAAVLALGSTEGRDTIGRSSPPAGKAEVALDGKPVTVDPGRNWVEIPLAPDTRHQYTVTFQGRTMQGEFRTYPEADTRLCFVVIGDYGTGEAPQYALAKVLASRVASSQSQSCPVRFVLTTGDNIYGRSRFLFGRTETGESDRDWEARFFAPYEDVLRRVPFYPTLGNHDGSESEHQGDLRACLDNFFFPGDVQAEGRYYRFWYANVAEFFALDTTKNAPVLGIAPGSAQFRWVEESLHKSAARWKIPYYHHPRYCGGPGHSSRPDLDPLMRVFERNGVAVVFNGHEHNWQPIEEKLASGRSLYHVITGAGGELRTGRPSVAFFDNNKARALDWAPKVHFTLVEIDGNRLIATPIGTDNQPVAQPLLVTLP